MEFIRHNILLNNGQKTMGDKEILLEKSGLWTSIAKTLDHFLLSNPGIDRSKVRVADLGCQEGGYAVAFARMGFDVTGIEAREDNLEKCSYVKENLKLNNLHFYKDDVRHLERYGKFDIILNYGLLYHLNDPISFLKQCSACTTKMMFLNTHIAPENDIRYEFGDAINRYIINPIQKRVPFLNTRRNYKLSKLKENEGYKGRWYLEWSPKADKKKIEKNSMASYNNYKSFWLCKLDLTKALHNVGFHSVFEQFDFIGDIAQPNYHEYLGRVMMVGFKS